MDVQKHTSKQVEKIARVEGCLSEKSTLTDDLILRRTLEELEHEHIRTRFGYVSGL